MRVHGTIRPGLDRRSQRNDVYDSVKTSVSSFRNQVRGIKVVIDG